MENYYDILGVTPQASPGEIKSAFRKRIKSLHPDVQGGKAADSSKVHLLIEAYEILSDTSQRRAYDLTLRTTENQGKAFNYREFLVSRDDDESQGKLIFYDILRDRSQDAIERYAKLTKLRAFNLEVALGKEDFMDCAFLLALEFEAVGDLAQAIQIHLRLCQLENEKAYFRHFFVEVEERLKGLICRQLTWELDALTLVEILEELQNYEFRAKTKSAFLKKQAETYYSAGQGILARSSLERAIKMNPRDSLLHKLKNQWGF